MRVGQPVALAAALVAVLCAGIWLGGHSGKLPEPLRDAFVDETAVLSAEAAEVIEGNYFREVDVGELGDASINGMVQRLKRRFHDRFSHYFNPEDLERFKQSIEGRFSGIGVTVREVRRGLRVGRIIGGAPAADAGIEVGDVIVSVNGKSIAGKDAEIASARIKGKAGTTVRLGIFSPVTGKIRSVEVERAEIDVPVVAARIRTVADRKLGYVQFVSFTEGAHNELRQGVEKVLDRGAEGIVLDLRGNGGGLLREAILTSSVFLGEGETVVSTDSRTQGAAIYEAVGGNLDPVSVVVLINRDTASAAEILCAALAGDYGATVVGMRSYGKGVFQQVIDLSNEGALELTIGEYFTADGVSLAGKGIKPDVRAADDPRTRPDEALGRALGVLAQRLSG